MLTYADVCGRMGQVSVDESCYVDFLKCLGLYVQDVLTGTHTYADVCSRMLTYAHYVDFLKCLGLYVQDVLTGTQFTCFTSTRVQILTQTALTANELITVLEDLMGAPEMREVLSLLALLVQFTCFTRTVYLLYSHKRTICVCVILLDMGSPGNAWGVNLTKPLCLQH
jgi:hypothetical protein